MSSSICFSISGQIFTSAGAKAGLSTKINFGSPTNFLPSQRKGFSKL